MCIAESDFLKHTRHGDCLGTCDDNKGSRKEEIRMEVNDNELKLLVRPNPSNTYVTIIATSNQLNENIVLKITDATGRLIEVKNTMTSKSIQIGSSYRPGFYI